MDFQITKKSGVIQWTKEQIDYIIDKYENENYSFQKLGELFSCAPATIRLALQHNGIESQACKHGYPRDSFYFHKIDSPDKAYWLGLLYADGTVSEKGKSVSLQLIDKEHIEKFKEAIGAVNHKIGTTVDTRWDPPKIIYHTSMKDKQLYADLVSYGCVPRKTYSLSKLPDLNDSLMYHFIRGYFDGDGSIHFVKCNDQYRISFCGTDDFLNDLKIYLGKPSLKLSRGSNISQLQIMGRVQVERYLDKIYEGSTEKTRLNRKYEKYLDMKERQRQRKYGN